MFRNRFLWMRVFLKKSEVYEKIVKSMVPQFENGFNRLNRGGQPLEPFGLSPCRPHFHRFLESLSQLKDFWSKSDKYVSLKEPA
jgi:hypothetical protein